jgi:hypothetical protein
MASLVQRIHAEATGTQREVAIILMSTAQEASKLCATLKLIGGLVISVATTVQIQRQLQLQALAYECMPLQRMKTLHRISPFPLSGQLRFPS